MDTCKVPGVFYHKVSRMSRDQVVEPFLSSQPVTQFLFTVQLTSLIVLGTYYHWGNRDE